MREEALDLAPLSIETVTATDALSPVARACAEERSFLCPSMTCSSAWPWAWRDVDRVSDFLRPCGTSSAQTCALIAIVAMIAAASRA